MEPTTEQPAQRFFYIARRGRKPVRIEAASVCDDEQNLRFKKNGKLVGSVAKRQHHVLGWWVEDESLPGPYRCVELGDQVARFACDSRLRFDGDTTEFRFDGQVTARVYIDIQVWWLEGG